MAFLQDYSTGVLICTFILLLILYHMFSESKNEPPGPKPLPLLGNLLKLDVDKPHVSLSEVSWRRTKQAQFVSKHNSVFLRSSDGSTRDMS